MTKDILEAHLYTYKATCRRVVDGDTLDLNMDLGLRVYTHCRVRLFGIDTPEIHGVKKVSKEYGEGMKSKKFVEEALFGRNLTNHLGPPRDIWVETRKDKTGKYGRYLAVVWYELHGEVINLNELLVKEGLAEAKTY